MSLKNQLESDLHESMRKKENMVKETIRMILSSVKFSEIESRKELDDQGIITIIQKEVKIRNETLKELETTEREDLRQKAYSEIKILEKYLPNQVSDREIMDIVQSTILEISAGAISDMGKVMKIVIPKLAGSATPERISTIVRTLLS